MNKIKIIGALIDFLDCRGWKPIIYDGDDKLINADTVYEISYTHSGVKFTGSLKKYCQQVSNMFPECKRTIFRNRDSERPWNNWELLVEFPK